MTPTARPSWPPPPDLESIRELVRDADVEGFIQAGAPADEYDTEAEQLHAAIAHLRPEEITVAGQLPILEAIWRKSFADDDAELAQRQPALQKLAEQVTRFFGPEAQPTVRS